MAGMETWRSQKMHQKWHMAKNIEREKSYDFQLWLWRNMKHSNKQMGMCTSQFLMGN